jgi:hypothetical protein
MSDLSENSVAIAIEKIKNNIEKQDRTQSKIFRKLNMEINNLSFNLSSPLTCVKYDTTKYIQELKQMSDLIFNILKKIKDRSIYIKYCTVSREYYVGQTHDNIARQNNHKYKHLKITEILVENLDSKESDKLETYFMNCPPLHIEDYKCINQQKLRIDDYYAVGYELAKKLSISNPNLKICYYKRVPFDNEDYKLKYNELKQKHDKLIELIKELT